MKIFGTTLYSLNLIVTFKPKTISIWASDSYESITTMISKHEGEYSYGEVEIAVTSVLRTFISYDDSEIAVILQDMRKEFVK